MWIRIRIRIRNTDCHDSHLAQISLEKVRVSKAVDRGDKRTRRLRVRVLALRENSRRVRVMEPALLENPRRERVLDRWFEARD